MHRSEPSYRLGVDVGGTFTDILLLEDDTGSTWRHKVPSTPNDPSLAVKHGIEQILANVSAKSDIRPRVINHGTTIATNAILEQKGAKVALVVTEGFKDILQTRRSQVPGGLASWITWKKPEPLAPLELTVEAPGRIATDGTEVSPFDEQTLIERLQKVVAAKPDAVTISLINSFANPSHEQQALKVVSKVFPSTTVSISSEVLPELMEYERTITTVVNAYIIPSVSNYLHNLLDALQNKTEHLRVLRSDGGLSSVFLARRFPVTMAMSGPAGGVTGVASLVAGQTKFKNLITLDMGGTSTDVALIENGVPRIRRETKIGDLVIKTPSIDVRTVGAGGGSIALVPEVTKALRVGPESAGAFPGPACYSKGGRNATVTDANAVLGYLPKFLLGGAFELDLSLAKEAVGNVANDLNIGLYEAAEGILNVSNETMYGALRLVSVEQGFDPRNFSLVAFGGAGPMHANALGELLGAYPVIVPPSPGILCAHGDATTLLRHEKSRSYMCQLTDDSTDDILKAFDELQHEVESLMSNEQGVSVEKQHKIFLFGFEVIQVFKHEFDLRYVGQAMTVSIELKLERLRTEGPAILWKLFEVEHEKHFFFKLTTQVELINLRVIAEEVSHDIPTKQLERAEGPDPPSGSILMRTTLVFNGQENHDCPIWLRSKLKAGHVVLGPCVVTEMDSNTVIQPGFRAEIDLIGNILIWKAEDAHEDDRGSHSLTGCDAITTDIFENALRNARNEMDTLMTTATMSPAIREQQDEFNVIAEPSGKMIVGQFGSFIGQFLSMWKGSIEPDDIFITNDPYSVGGAVSHLNDWLIMMPIFVGSKLIAWAANFGHMTDSGGGVPGSLPTAAQSIFEEGIQVPVTKLASRGVWNHDLAEILYRNCRLPEWNRCDTLALVAACRLAKNRMIELHTRFGDKLYFEAIQELLERNRRTISSLIESAIPESPVTFEDWIDDDGRGIGPWKIACTMSKNAGRLKFDFTGTDPQSPSSINFYLSQNMFKMFVGIYLVAVYDPSTIVNDGFHDLLDVIIPKGTILNPVRPAALSCRTHLLGRLMDVLSGLLGQKAPEFMTAAGFSDSPHFMYSGFKPNGDWFQLYQIGFGGIPARPFGDGMDGHCLWPAMKSVPNEFLERYYPLRIEQYNTVADSGGPGLFRGGNAQRIFYRFLEEGEISLHDDRWLSKPWGVLGGEPGARSSKTLVHYAERATPPRREVLASKQDHVRVSVGDVLEWITWGGGGYGDALNRDADFVALEVSRGLVSVEGARRYGVVLTSEFCVDVQATDELRSQLREAMNKHSIELINRGGTWEELKAKALEETGLPPPKDIWTVPLRGPMTGLPHIKSWMLEHGQIV